MSAGAGESPQPHDSPILVPELRDYHQINAEVVRRLNRGDGRVQLEGPAGHRLLLAGLSGTWEAIVEIDGVVGPEMAAGMDAPGIVVVCRGASADGAGSCLRAGSILLLGESGTAVGYRMSGGLIVATRSVGPRAGLGMSGGSLVLMSRTGPMPGDRQEGGLLVLPDAGAGPNAGLGARGGRVAPASTIADEEPALIRRALELEARFSTRRDEDGRSDS